MVEEAHPVGQPPLYSAVDGLAGVHDLGGQFEKVKLAPAWANSEYNTAYSSTSYGASDKYIAYTMEHDRDNSKLIYKVCGDSKDVYFQILVPTGSIAENVIVNGQEVSFENTQTHNSVYANFKLSRSSILKLTPLKLYTRLEPLRQKKKQNNPIFGCTCTNINYSIGAIVR